jgi:NADP-dependent 3-hydroxy acid dehydrogenase YdfG
MSYLADKVVAVTGAAGGFGREIAAQSAARGAVAIVIDVDEAAAIRTAASITEAGGTAQGIGLDVRDRAAFAAAIRTVVDAHGHVDVLVNNAGIMPLAYLSDHERAAEAWDRCVDVNLKGVMHGIYAVHDHMLRQGGGHIVNISSIYGNAGIAGSAVYSATKAAIATLSNALRVETQGRIKVTLVRPSGMTGTGLSAGILDYTAPAALAAHRVDAWQDHVTRFAAGTLPAERTDPESAACWTLRPADAAAQVVHLMDQPLGVAVTEITLRATGEDYVY